MVSQIIKGEKTIASKYHPHIKVITFECNFCHKEFEKPESYYKKQLKRRKLACCFCSVTCRTKYLSKHKVYETTAEKLPEKKSVTEQSKQKKPDDSTPPPQNILQKILSYF